MIRGGADVLAADLSFSIEVDRNDGNDHLIFRSLLEVAGGGTFGY